VYLVDNTPTSIVEAYASSDKDDWKETVRSEIDSLLSNGTWELSELPFGCKHVGCKWVFKKELKPDGTIDKYKARLVAKAYTQKEGYLFTCCWNDHYLSATFSDCLIWSSRSSDGCEDNFPKWRVR
jgi:hypothetical protein